MHQLSDEILIEAYLQAIEQKLDAHFINLLLEEIQSRGINIDALKAS
ncbi:hypothetical protein DNHGIG_26940 [Collibacillus ludicampi]|uniref:Sporulation histidine kinase inhibitor Sda n=1 Tax=Collibacillus ludicampi TaxID=2771369 RepID=A0AAV4LH89_9BACL|nr:sporulation histidine kinase inhibitor Sda [Collibacillus ludicampi]GIM47145.1 hypothetical protein DNHGIG_26940 [Collibacillus ludicampi]